jgi:hypothetical protein
MMLGIPSKITAGDSISWIDCATTDNLGNRIASDEWTLKYFLRGNAVAATLEVTATPRADGGWDVALSAANTLLFNTVPLMFWTAKVTRSAEVKTLGSGQSAVIADLSAVPAGAFDGSSQARKDLTAVRTAMRTMIAGGAVQEYSVAGRSVKRMTMADLLTLESKLLIDVQRENAADALARGDRPGSNLRVRFT